MTELGCFQALFCCCLLCNLHLRARENNHKIAPKIIQRIQRLHFDEETYRLLDTKSLKTYFPLNLLFVYETTWVCLKCNVPRFHIVHFLRRCSPARDFPCLRCPDYKQRPNTVGRNRLDEFQLAAETYSSQHTRHSQQTASHTPGGIRTHNPSKRLPTDPRFTPRGHWD